MAMAFHSPSYRAASSDLTIAVSPLGLVELADEEFEVHGPRLNRYAAAWAWYLGHHWAYRREAGEPQLTFNYVRAFADYINSFTFGKGVSFRSPDATEDIVPGLLKRAWEVDNSKERALWEIGQNGGITGDSFVKVAYEEPYVDPSGQVHNGRVRVLPLNSAYCFPEFHPHDRTRLIRFKLKYRFWGTALEGTRQVFTYTELMTEEAIEEYINDELIDSRANPLGVIPIVHIPNVMVSSSPWGLSDIGDILTLNREYNEKMTVMSDIIDYHGSPVTIVKGAKVANLEKGPRKVWGGIPKDGDVYNLEMENDFAGYLGYLELLKRSMHELTGVPESALGQMQPISNTSGVALSIMYQPLMNKYGLKKNAYGEGLMRINEMVLRTLALKEPESFVFNPMTSGQVVLEPDQYPVLDLADPITYQSTVHWPPPLPVDILIKLNEIQLKMALGLMSKEGALRELGEEFPQEVLAEIFMEQQADMRMQGALDLDRSNISAAIAQATGMVPMPDGSAMPMVAMGRGNAGRGGAPSGSGSPSTGGSSGPNAGGGPPPIPLPSPMEQAGVTSGIMNELVTKAYGTKIPQRRNPDSES
jgi:hypothetical protein